MGSTPFRCAKQRPASQAASTQESVMGMWFLRLARPISRMFSILRAVARFASWSPVKAAPAWAVSPIPARDIRRRTGKSAKMYERCR